MKVWRGYTSSVDEVVRQLKAAGSAETVKGMSRFGIQTARAFGVSIPKLRAIAKKVGKNHDLALQLWETEVHEARILASMIDTPENVTEGQMEKWAKGFDSWDVVDGCCGNLFEKTPFAVKKAIEWSRRDEEFVKRAGFVMMAELAVHDKKASNETFLEFLPLIVKEASDNRNFVKKAVNWALRQIGKRNLALNEAAIHSAKMVGGSESRAAKWVASDALRELTSAPVQKMLRTSSRRVQGHQTNF